MEKYEYLTVAGKVDLAQMGENGWYLIHIGRNYRLQKVHIFIREKRINLCERGF